ncbi:hypothetical protein BH09BAC5_BH09BAC5_27090 [soil metagenome]
MTDPIKILIEFSLKISKRFLVVILIFISTNIFSQNDSLNSFKTRNQISIEISGNNFPACLASICYSRKVSRNEFCLIPFVGIGIYKNKFPDFGFNDNQLKYSGYGGFLFKPNSKRNGFEYGLSCAIAIGTWKYTLGVGHYGEPTIYHDVNFCLTPGVYYQFQNNKESFFIRPFAGLKMFSGLFSHNYRGVNSSNYKLWIWLGINFGFGW